MIGIYKITNNKNNLAYVGQSNNIQRRFSEHRSKKGVRKDSLHSAIQSEGVENFLFEVLEECALEDLNRRETYWIRFYDTVKTGYNFSYGGDEHSTGENNGRAKISESEVVEIRKAYNNKERRRDVYKKYSHKISFHTFASIWDGTQWSHVMPEVFSKENLEFFSRKASNGELSTFAAFSNEEVLKMRERYVSETAKSIYQGIEDRCSYQTLQQILWGRTYKDLPIYKKKEKKWIGC